MLHLQLLRSRLSLSISPIQSQPVRSGASEFYFATKGSCGPAKLRTPLTLSNHLANPPTQEEVIRQAKRSARQVFGSGAPDHLGGRAEIDEPDAIHEDLPKVGEDDFVCFKVQAGSFLKKLKGHIALSWLRYGKALMPTDLVKRGQKRNFRKLRRPVPGKNLEGVLDAAFVLSRDTHQMSASHRLPHLIGCDAPARLTQCMV